MVYVSTHGLDSWVKRGNDPTLTKDEIEELWYHSREVEIDGKSGRKRHPEGTGAVLIGKWDKNREDWVITTVIKADYETLKEKTHGGYCHHCGIEYDKGCHDGCPKCS